MAAGPFNFEDTLAWFRNPPPPYQRHIQRDDIVTFARLYVIFTFPSTQTIDAYNQHWLPYVERFDEWGFTKILSTGIRDESIKKLIPPGHEHRFLALPGFGLKGFWRLEHHYLLTIPVPSKQELERCSAPLNWSDVRLLKELLQRGWPIREVWPDLLVKTIRTNTNRVIVLLTYGGYGVPSGAMARKDISKNTKDVLEAYMKYQAQRDKIKWCTLFTLHRIVDIQGILRSVMMFVMGPFDPNTMIANKRVLKDYLAAMG